METIRCELETTFVWTTLPLNDPAIEKLLATHLVQYL